MRLPFAALTILALAACSDKELDQCEAAVKTKLKAPATYQRIAATKGPVGYDLEFDASNPAGVPIRYKGACYRQAGLMEFFATGSDGSSFVSDRIADRAAFEMQSTSAGER